MSRHALVKDGAILDWRDDPPNRDQSQLAEGKPRYLPLEIDQPSFDPVSQVREGPTYVVEANRVVEAYTVRAKNADEIQAMREAKDTAIEREFDARWTAPIEFEVGGHVHTWHADQNAVTNIMGQVLMIAAGAPVPNPRPWTPVGSFTPVDITHAELVGLGGAIAVRKDVLFAVKRAKQAAVAAMTDPAQIDAVNPAADWE